MTDEPHNILMKHTNINTGDEPRFRAVPAGTVEQMHANIVAIRQRLEEVQAVHGDIARHLMAMEAHLWKLTLYVWIIVAVGFGGVAIMLLERFWT